MTAGISINYFAPRPQGGSYLGKLRDTLSGYNHEKLARGGMWQAAIELNSVLADVEDWYESGLGRVIKVYNEAQECIFRGFANTISLNAGDITETRGPLLDTTNRCSAIYTPMNADVWPPVYGTETTTIIAEDEISQRLYGIIERFISAGRCTKLAAEKQRDLNLEESKDPPRTSNASITPGSSANAAVSIEVLGDIHWLTAYPYISTSSGYMTVHDKILALLAADPNGIFSTDTSQIYNNTFLVPAEDGDSKTAWDVLVGLLNLGHPINDEPMNLSLDADNRLIYQPISNTPEYIHSLGDNAQRVRVKQSNRIVYPWDIEPGKWLEVTDFLTGSLQSTTSLKSNPRLKFLESVSYSMPWSMDLSGGKTDRLSQLLAKLTYTGGVL